MNAPTRMPIERIAIENRDQWLALRKRDVTASAAGALLGVHDYVTHYSLWALKAGKIAEDPDENSAMKRGRLLEKVAIEMVQEANPNWVLTVPRHYYRDPAARLGATPDLFAKNDDGDGVIQIKTVEPGVFRRKWRDDETGELRPPLWIAVQAIVEAHLTGASWAAVAALVVGFGIDLHMVAVPIHADIIKRIKAEIVEFWRKVEADEPPQFDYARDGATIAALYGQASDATVDFSADNRLPTILAEDEALAEAEKVTKERRKEIKNEIIAKMGAAAFATCAGWAISAKTIRRAEYSVAASSYRAVKAKRLQSKE